MGFGYKIAQNMLYGKLPGQIDKINDSYDLWFDEINTHNALLTQLGEDSFIKQAYEKIRKSQEDN